MEVNVVRTEQEESELTTGDVIHFPQYGTWYVVHSCHPDVVHMYNVDPFEKYYLLFGFDGRKLYTKRPMTMGDIDKLVKGLRGNVFPQKHYKIAIQQR